MSDYDPPVTFSFAVGFAGSTAESAAFQEVSGLQSRHETVQLKEGGENRIPHRLPGRVKPPNLVLKRGMTRGNSDFFKWLQATMEGDLTKQIEPRDLKVSLFDQEKAPLMIWNVSRAWSVNWQIGGFDAMKNEIAVETVELAHSGLERAV